MQKLSLLSACIFALFLASCGGSSGGGSGGGGGGSADADSDGVPDSKDLCENSLDENFISDDTTDADKDGCEDSTEDQDLGTGDDEDNDGIFGTDINSAELDKCENGDKGWTSGRDTDYDSDGCQDDSTEDTDDDNDGVLDVNDNCSKGNTGWLSTTDATTGTDKDNDGCRDEGGEDKDLGTGDDEDNDGIFGNDPATSIELDKCENGDKGWTSNDQTDNDSDGCRDAGEDTDDDNDTILDVTDVDDDNNGLIEIATAEELINIRHDLDGTHYNDGSNSSDVGCPTTNPVGCNGYELTQDIRLADLTGSDTKNWDPVGSESEQFYRYLRRQ